MGIFLLEEQGQRGELKIASEMPQSSSDRSTLAGLSGITWNLPILALLKWQGLTLREPKFGDFS